MISESEQPQEMKRRVLNVRALSLLIVGSVSLYALTTWLHATQVGRTSEYLQSAAAQAIEDDDPQRALDLFDQYLVLHPRDLEVEEQISRLLDEPEANGRALLRAFQINERLLLADKTRDDIRLRQINIADRLNRHSDAAVHLRILREQRTDLSQVWHFSGVVAMDTGSFSEAIDFFSKAISLDNPDPRSFQFLANLLTTHADDATAAEQVLSQLVDHHDSMDARLIRAEWLQGRDRLADAIADLYDVIDADPVNVRANAMLVRSIQLAGETDRDFDVAGHYEKIISRLSATVKDNPEEHQLRIYLASALWAAGQQDAAINELEIGIERDPRQYQLHEALLDYLVSSGEVSRAQKIFDAIPHRAVDRSSVAFMRGRLLMANRDWAQAVESFERALVLAGENSDMSARSSICLGTCRRELGDDGAAMDTYRTLVTANPESEAGRLGMASAYLRSKQKSLAIAEYRQLLHVEGVPEFLANLMIKEISKLPPANRDWTEVERLLRKDDAPPITDDVQRRLLKADLKFAQGYPSQALDILAASVARYPQDEKIRRAVAQLTSKSDGGLNSRLLATLQEDPTNDEAHVSVLRLQLIRGDLQDMAGWLSGLVTGRLFPRLESKQRLLAIANATERVVESGTSVQRNQDQLELLAEVSEEAWQRLSMASDEYTLRYVRFVAKHKSLDAAVQIAAAADVTPVQHGECWLECLRYGLDRLPVVERVQRELTALITSNPSTLELRIVYADALILVEEYELAEKLLTQLTEFQGVSGAALARLAWMSLLLQQDTEQALMLSERAALQAPSDSIVRSVRGLVLAETGGSQQAVKVLQSIPREQRATASYLYEARSLFLRGNTSEAADLLRDLLPRAADLQPADNRMMKTLQRQLKITPPRVSSR